MTRPIAVVVAGRTFRSIKAAADHFGVSLQTAARRLRDGWSAEQALGVASSKRARTWPEERLRPIKTSGGTFRTVSEASTRFGVDAATIRRRLGVGWTADQAVGLAPPPARPPKPGIDVVCAGEAFATLKDLASRYGKPGSLVSRRIRRGWTPEQAVDMEPPPHRFRDTSGYARSHLWRSVEFVDGQAFPKIDVGGYKVYVVRNRRNGKEYVGITISPLPERFKGHRQAATRGVRGKLYNAMRRYGVDAFEIEIVRRDARSFRELQEQETAEIARRGTLKNGYNTSPGGSVGTSKGLRVGRLTFSSYGAAAEHFGIDPRVFAIRLNRLKWTPEQAAEIEPRPKFGRRRVTVGDREFKSLSAAAKAFGVPYKIAHARVLRDGWTIEQALDIAKPPESVKFQGIAVEAFGERFDSIAACARRYGIKPETLRAHVERQGVDIQTAIATLRGHPKPGARSHPVTAFGKQFSSITECAAHFGISPHSLKNRMRYKGESIEDAINHLRNSK